MTTLAPSRANSRAALSPIPDAAPVIKATLSLSLTLLTPNFSLFLPKLIACPITLDVYASIIARLSHRRLT
jgi:hypothetical protein